MRLPVVLLLVSGCERTQTPPPEITVSPTPSSSSSSSSSAGTVAVPSVTASAMPSAAPSASVDPEPEPFGTLWLSCRKDSDCTVVSLGCCHARAIAKKYEAEGQRVLNESKLEHCPVKAACAQAPAVCSHAICKLTK